MTIYYAPKQSGQYIKSEGNGDISNEIITLKQNSTAYQPGELVISEYSGGSKTGLYIRATATLAAATTDEDYAFVRAYTDASAGNTKVTATVRLAEVQKEELVYDSSLTISAIAGLVKGQNIFIR